VTVLALAGCSSGSASPSSPSLPSASSSAPSGGPSTAAAVPVLPESVLPSLPGLEYQEPPQGDAASAASIAASVEDPGVFDGVLVRSVLSEGTQVGGVEVLRLDPGTPLDGEAVKGIVAEFAQKPGGAALLGGRPVWQADDARGEGVGAVAWADGQDLTLVWAQGLDGARRLAALVLAGRG
jgi:hypothetical protein